MQFDRLVHADWSKDAKKRWMATATKAAGRWDVFASVQVPKSETFLNDVLAQAIAGQRILIGLDFPIGVPINYATKTGCTDFKAALASFGEGSWSRFFDVANNPSDISVLRPFYPDKSRKGVTPNTLVEKLGLATRHDLLRQCERKTDHRGAACSLFWTLGGNQVGKASIAGWREVVRPAIARGAWLWPFDGTLADLCRLPGVVIAETYPAEAYHHVGIAFRRDESKRRREDRRSKAGAIFGWAIRNGVNFDSETRETIKNGFGSADIDKTGEDAFDAFSGLLGMIEVVDERRNEGPLDLPGIRTWEGWILGRAT